MRRFRLLRNPAAPRAFSLVEMSVVIVIVAIVSVLGLEATGVFLGRTAYATTQQKLAIIDQALRNYYKTTGRLPCPTSFAVSEQYDTASTYFAMEHCGGGSYGGATVIYNGAVSSVGVSNPGSGYTGAPTATISGTGGATASVTVSGVVTGITGLSGGSGYTTAPAVVFSGGGGKGAMARATVTSGAVTAVTILNAGSGYTTAPTVTFPSAVGTGANASAVRDANGITAATVITAGSNYSTVPTVTFNANGAGSGAVGYVGTTLLYWGGVPTAELQLPFSAGVDGYGSRIDYVVTQGLTNSYTFAGTPGNIEVRTGLLQQPCSTNCQVLADPAAARLPARRS